MNLIMKLLFLHGIKNYISIIINKIIGILNNKLILDIKDLELALLDQMFLYINQNQNLFLKCMLVKMVEIMNNNLILI